MCFKTLNCPELRLRLLFDSMTRDTSIGGSCNQNIPVKVSVPDNIALPSCIMYEYLHYALLYFRSVGFELVQYLSDFN